MAEVEMGDNVTETWPPRWTKPQFKATKRKTTKAARASKRRKLTKVENSEKQKVRDRDKVCRFPMCGCRTRGIALHVSHSKHRGMGGNPTGDRTQTPLMVLVCAARHRENRISIDRGTLQWRALTSAGADGPIAWDVRKDEVPKTLLRTGHNGIGGDWIELYKETPDGPSLLQSTPAAINILKWLASMEV